MSDGRNPQPTGWNLVDALKDRIERLERLLCEFAEGSIKDGWDFHYHTRKALEQIRKELIK